MSSNVNITAQNQCWKLHRNHKMQGKKSHLRKGPPHSVPTSVHSHFRAHCICHTPVVTKMSNTQSPAQSALLVPLWQTVHNINYHRYECESYLVWPQSMLPHPCNKRLLKTEVQFCLQHKVKHKQIYIELGTPETPLNTTQMHKAD